MKKQSVGIVGGGVAGLTLAWELVNKGYRVKVFEKEKELGGLAAGFKEGKWRWPLDNFYRHIFGSDKDFFTLLKELGIENELYFRRPISSILFQGKIYPFDSPVNILSFPHLSLFSRFRLGAGIAILKYLPYCRLYERVTAHVLLPNLIGKNSYQLVWKPLLKQKFGADYKKVPMSWFWARVRSRTPKLGYFRQSFSGFINVLAKKITAAGGEVETQSEIKKINKNGDKLIVSGTKKSEVFDKIILTTPLPISWTLARHLIKRRVKSRNLKILGAAVLILRLRKRFLPDRTYWLNVLEKNWPFVAVVEHTNFIEPKNYDGETIVYLGGYYDGNDMIFTEEAALTWKRFLPFVKRLNPAIEKDLIGFHKVTNRFAQPVSEVNYPTKAPVFTTGTQGLFWLSLHHIFPWDRGMNYAVKYAKLLAKEIVKNNGR